MDVQEGPVTWPTNVNGLPSNEIQQLISKLPEFSNAQVGLSLVLCAEALCAMMSDREAGDQPSAPTSEWTE